MTQFYAKSASGGETLQEHSEGLIERLENFKNIYGRKIDNLLKDEDEKETFWEDLRHICIVHDLGKISIPFQNKIRKKLGLPVLQGDASIEIPHNFLSPSFLVGLDGMNDLRFNSIFLSIAFHHDRQINFDNNLLRNTIEGDLKKNITAIKAWVNKYLPDFSFEKPYSSYYPYLRSFLNKDNACFNTLRRTKRFIFLKGLLHRLDHSASAHVPVEEDPLTETSKKLINYLKNEKGETFSGLKPFQKQATKYRNKSVLLTASTGMGKTEFAINWMGEDKGFYTLPLRVSTNAMYKRMYQMFGDNVGILHSDSFSLTIDDEKLSMEENLNRLNLSRQLAKPLMVTTADQLFTSVFKWPGYEKIYATLMYSKVILDEPQSYSPKTLAMIVKALEEISAYGGKFCYMSATNHPFIIEKLKTSAVELVPVYNYEKKHKLCVNEDETLDGFLRKIVKKYEQGKKVLVITNTVKKSQEIFLKLNKSINKKLLNAGFIKKHRSLKEKEIQDDFKENEPSVVWVSTQIVEASLDIDYDILFTEIATLDSLIQRMGRIYRGIGRTIHDTDEPNIYVACKNPSDNHYIYNKELCNFTMEELKKHNEKIITEETKQDLMNKVYNIKRIQTTNYFQQYENAYNLLEYGFESDSRSEAQRLFREIAQITGIPEVVYSQNTDEIDSLISKSKDKTLTFFERMKSNQKLLDYTLSIPIWKARDSIRLNSDRRNPIFLLPGKYDPCLGLMYKEIENTF